MNILLVNDDGYDKPGFAILAKLLKEYGDVYISAPYREKSGASASITLFYGLEIKIKDEHRIVVDGTPADCAIFGLSYFKDVKFDLIVSGPNNGYNRSIDTIFSGTIGAGMAGSFAGVKVICLSSDWGFYETIEKYSRESIDYILKEKLLDECDIVSVNFPTKKYLESKGIRFAYLQNRKYGGELVERNGKYYPKDMYSGEIMAGSEIALNEAGYISLTPLKPSYFDLAAFNQMKAKHNK